MQDLTHLFEPVVVAMGYELVGMEFQRGGGHGTLRVFIDREAGVDLEDCAAISHQISGILDVEEPIQQAYDLEISSPGLDRPLFKLEDYDRFSGQMAKIKLAVALDGRKNFMGQLQGAIDASTIVIEVDGQPFELAFADIAKANLIGERLK